MTFEVVMCIFLPLVYECLCKSECVPHMVGIHLFPSRPDLSTKTLLHQYVSCSDVSLLLLTGSLVVEDFGCIAPTYFSVVSLVLVQIPLVITGLAIMVYTGKRPP